MTELQSGEAAEVETNTDAAAQAALSSQDTTSERNWEAEAREMGWVPEAEFKGDRRPKKFLSAEEFVERGETMLPILNERLKKQKTEFEDRIAKLEKVNEATRERMQRQHEKEISDLKAERREAIKAGDADKVDKLDAEIDKLKEEGPETPKTLTGKDLEKHNEKVQKDWMKANSWYNSDDDMTAYALGYSQRLAASDPDITIEDNLAKVDAAMRKRFPEFFGEKKTGANGHAPVDGGGDLPGSGARKDTLFAKLPPEAKAQCSKDVKAGLYKSNEEWAKAYFN